MSAVRVAVWTMVAVANLAAIYVHAAQDASETSEPHRISSPHHGNANRLEERVKVLAESLNLDMGQQVELRKILEKHRDQVQAVWNDTAIPAARRVIATRAVSDQTADQIRAMLNEEQRKKYNAPKPQHDSQAGNGKRSVEEWMNATQSKQ